MADNPFAQYAPQPAATANPFAQYATSTPSSSEIPTTRRSYSLAQVPLEAGKNLSSSAGQFVSGVVQAVTSPLQTLQGITDIAVGGVYNLMPKAVQSALDSMEQDVESQQRAIRAANAAGGYVKDRFGSWDAIKRTLAEDPVGAAGDLSTLLTMGAGAARNIPAITAGGLKVAGATAPATAVARTIAPVSKAVAPVAAFGQTINPMRPIAPIIEAPIKLVSKGVNALYNALDPKSAAYLTASEGRGPQIVNALRGDTQIVPGSLPTAAEAAAPVGATRFSAMGASSKKTLPTEYFEKGQAQKAAQVAQIQTVGKTAEDLAAAQAARTTTAGQLYGLADQALVSADQTFAKLLDRPSMDKVIARASQLAAEKDIPFQIGQNRPAQVTPSQILDASGKPMGQTVIPAEVAKYPGSSLHMMKMAFDDLVKNPERFGIGANEVGAINSTRGQFLKWAEQESKNPAYKTARETFAKQSKPINQMQVGQYLEGKLKPVLEGGDAAEGVAGVRANVYAGALNEAPGTIKRSTGQSRFDRLTEVLEPDQIAAVNSVRDDLARARLAEQQAAAARGAGPDVNLMGTATLADVRAPNFINTITTVANDLMRKVQGKLDQKLAIELATEMLDPNAAATALQKALNRQARGEKLANPFVKTGKAASAVLRTPAVVNALAQPSEKRNALIED
jgi:hypothetical protein